MPDTTREAMERAVIGALKSAIKDHGPITKDRITSATKRVLGNLANVSAETAQCTCGRGDMGFPHTVSCTLAGRDGDAQLGARSLMRPQDRALLVEARDGLRAALDGDDCCTDPKCPRESCRKLNATLAKLDEALK